MFENQFKLCRQTTDNSVLPYQTQAHLNQYFLKSRVNILIPASYDKSVKVNTGLTVNLKLHHQLLIFGRQIDVIKHSLVVPDLQIITKPITTELQVPLINLSDNDIYVNAGDIIATAMFVQIDPIK